MENYERQLLSINPIELPKPESSLPYQQLLTLTSIESSNEYEKEVIKLAQQIPFNISKWPSFGSYSEDWFNVEVSVFKNQLQYCERGSFDIRENCQNQIVLFYQILDAVMPRLTSSAIETSNKLDRIKDQRLLIWLRMSSKIYLMYKVNEFFGKSMLTKNTIWMCQELVRMGVFKSTIDAFNSEKHIIKGLSICGTPIETAKKLYNEIKNA
ncbi:hypothetical protein N8927_00320 [Crocinitomicaceae bacterium]|jgi:hypothetical protein|nr:hypothetical protein [Crocinitomicaceae bacterium]